MYSDIKYAVIVITCKTKMDMILKYGDILKDYDIHFPGIWFNKKTGKVCNNIQKNFNF